MYSYLNCIILLCPTSNLCIIIFLWYYLRQKLQHIQQLRAERWLLCRRIWGTPPCYLVPDRRCIVVHSHLLGDRRIETWHVLLQRKFCKILNNKYKIKSTYQFVSAKLFVFLHVFCSNLRSNLHWCLIIIILWAGALIYANYYRGKIYFFVCM